MIEVVRPSVELLTPVKELEYNKCLIERAARNCYKSEEYLGVDTDNFINKIMNLGHLSVIEHRSITVKFVIDRSASHQLVRHRLAAYSQESQRYCNYSKDRFGGKLGVICPPKIQANSEIFEEWKTLCEADYAFYVKACNAGIPAEDARSKLPNGCKTEVVSTFNLRVWRHVFKKRALDMHAQWQIRSVMQNALQILAQHCPLFFDDLCDKLQGKLDNRDLSDIIAGSL